MGRGENVELIVISNYENSKFIEFLKMLLMVWLTRKNDLQLLLKCATRLTLNFGQNNFFECNYFSTTRKTVQDEDRKYILFLISKT